VPTRPILVVDDEPDLVATYERLLRRLGYRVITAGTRVGGLAALGHEPLRLVISDLRLPDGDGLDVVRAAGRTTPQPTPAIVVTGFGSETSRAAALAAGAVGYLAKPFATTEFLALVRRAVGADGQDGMSV
jgi:two-component system response regulator PilR (NtrC family)